MSKLVRMPFSYETVRARYADLYVSVRDQGYRTRSFRKLSVESFAAWRRDQLHGAPVGPPQKSAWSQLLAELQRTRNVRRVTYLLYCLFKGRTYEQCEAHARGCGQHVAAVLMLEPADRWQEVFDTWVRARDRTLFEVCPELLPPNSARRQLLLPGV